MNVCLVCNNGVIPGEAEPRSRTRASGVEKSPSVASLIEHAKTKLDMQNRTRRSGQRGVMNV